MEHLLRRGARYYHRIRIPKDLTGIFGRLELVRSIRTSSRDEARAKGARVSYAVIQFFELIRRKMNMLSRSEVEDLTKAFYARLLEEDSRERLNPDQHLNAKKDARARFHLEEMAEPGETIDDVIARAPFSVAELVKDDEDFLDLDHWETTVANRDFRETDSLVPLLLEGTGLVIQKDSPQYRQLGLNAAKAIIEAKKIALERAKGDWSASSNDPLFRDVTESYERKVDARMHATFEDVADKFLNERDTGNPAYRHDYAGSLSLFTAYFGERTRVGSYVREDIVAFKDALRKTPAGYLKKYPGVTIKEAILRNEKDKHPTLTARTINDGHLSRLGAIFRWALNNSYLRADVMKDVRVDEPKSKVKQKPRSPFKTPELSALFEGPVFCGCLSATRTHEKGKFKVSDHRYWLPLVALFTGGRLGELGQLSLDDVRQENGIHYLELEDDPDEDDSAVRKRIKTEQSRRKVPLHPELVRLGFISYVEQQRQRGEKRVFSKCQRDKRGSFSPFTKWFGRHLIKLGIKTPRTSFHSFRHNFEDVLRSHVRDEELRRALAGRVFANSATLYGDGFPLDRLHEEISQIECPGLDLSHLIPAGPKCR
jgi:integrase